MITFGELRRLATQWGVLVDVVERAYVLDWILKGLFDRESIKESAVVRGETALAKAFFAEYPMPDGIELGLTEPIEANVYQGELEAAAREASAVSGLTLALTFSGSVARFGFTGPLGRRSAAQPHIVVRRVPIKLRRLATEARLIHPFSDACPATLRAVSLEELAAARLALLGQAPRVRDVFDLWYILTHGSARLDRDATLSLAGMIAAEKKTSVPTAAALFSEAHRPILARGWEGALRTIRGHPSLEKVEQDLAQWLATDDH